MIPRLLGEVWEFLKTASVRPAGHNVVVYRSPDADGVDVEAEVQVSGEFPSNARLWRGRQDSTPPSHMS